MNFALIDLVMLVNDFVLDVAKNKTKLPDDLDLSVLSAYSDYDLIDEIDTRHMDGRISTGDIIGTIPEEDLLEYIKYESNICLDDMYDSEEIKEYVMDNWDVDDLIDIRWNC